MNLWEDVFKCPRCGTTDVVPAFGNENSKVLIVGAYPGADEIKEGRPMAGRSGGVLKSELAFLGVDIKRLRLTNMWLHKPTGGKEVNNNPCLQYSIEKVIEEAKGKEAILLIGSDTVEFFCHVSVEAYNGLLVQSAYLSAPVIMACIQPATIFHGGGIGELRLTLQKFEKLIRRFL